MTLCYLENIKTTTTTKKATTTTINIHPQSQRKIKTFFIGCLSRKSNEGKKQKQKQKKKNGKKTRT